MVESVLVGGSTGIKRLRPVKYPLETYKATDVRKSPTRLLGEDDVRYNASATPTGMLCGHMKLSA